MLTPLHLQRWADVLVRHAVNVQPGHVVRITAQPLAEPLLEAVYRRVLLAGGLPVVNCRPECLAEAFYELASEAQLDWRSPFAQLEAERIDSSINLSSTSNLRMLDRFPPERFHRAARAQGAHRELFFNRAAAGDDPAGHPDLRPLWWSTTLFPSDAYAQDAGMSLRDYQSFVVRACQLDRDDPVSFWQELDRWQQLLAARLMTGRVLHFQTPAGTDLRVDVSGMRWLSSPGRKNFPDGERRRGGCGGV